MDPADNVPAISDRILGGTDSNKVDSTVALEPADLHRRTLVSDMDSDSVAEVFNPDEVPQSTRKSRIVRQKVDLDKFFGEREVAEWHGKRKRKPGKHHVGRSCDYVASGHRYLPTKAASTSRRP